MERGHPERARKDLEKVRGTKNVDDELALLTRATDIAKASENPFKALCFRRKNIPQFVLCIAFPFFQQASHLNNQNATHCCLLELLMVKHAGHLSLPLKRQAWAGANTCLVV